MNQYTVGDTLLYAIRRHLIGNGGRLWGKHVYNQFAPEVKPHERRRKVVVISRIMAEQTNMATVRRDGASIRLAIQAVSRVGSICAKSAYLIDELVNFGGVNDTQKSSLIIPVNDAWTILSIERGNTIRIAPISKSEALNLRYHETGAYYDVVLQKSEDFS